jgi:hypothetical protein
MVSTSTQDRIVEDGRERIPEFAEVIDEVFLNAMRLNIEPDEYRVEGFGMELNQQVVPQPGQGRRFEDRGE